MNVSKIIAYQGKTVTLQNLLKKAQARNQDLKSEKKMVTSDNSLEGIARNNLKMAGEDEVLIIINQKVEQPKKKKDKWSLKDLFKKKFNEEYYDLPLYTSKQKSKNHLERTGIPYLERTIQNLIK